MSKNLIDLLSTDNVENKFISAIKDIKIEKVIAKKEEKEWNIYLKSENYIDQNTVDYVKKTLNKKYDLANKIRIIPPEGNIQNSNKDNKITLEYIDNNYMDNIISYLSDKIPFIGGWIRNSKRTIKGDRYIFTFCNSFGTEFLKSKRFEELLEEHIYNNYGVKAKVGLECKNEEENNEKYLDEKESEDIKMVSELITNPPDINNNSSLVKENSKSSYIIGKRVDAGITSISEINELSGKVTIEGDAFSSKIIETKSGRTIVCFNVTDYDNSITVKVFPNEKESDSVKLRIKDGSHFIVRGEASFDKYAREVVLLGSDILETQALIREDKSKEKRVELHLHTQMSSMDGLTPAKDLVKMAAKWGHKAIAITDHGVVQAFPEAAVTAKKYGIKVIYGVEAYLVYDSEPIVESADESSIDNEYVALDIETTGLSNTVDRITEIGAVRIKGGEVVDRFNELINPEIPIPEKIINLTGITNEMVNDKPTIDEVLPRFIEFIKDSPLVAHNAKFDMGFIKRNANKMGYPVNNIVIDTLVLSRILFPKLKKYKLDVVAKHLNVSLENHHRAEDDALCAGLIYSKCIDMLKEKGANTLSDINTIFAGKQDIKKMNTYHTVILVKNYEGLLNLYKLISMAHLDYYYRKPRIPKSLLEQYREGLIIGSGCEAGLLFREILKGADDNEIKDIVRFYDYLEIQPIGNNEFLVRNNTVDNDESLRNINREIVKLGKKYNKPVVATGDVHFLNPKDEVYRRILMAGQGYEDADFQAPLYFKTTNEMLEEFSYLGEDTAYEVVVKNTNIIADMVDDIKPIPDETFPPKIDGAEEDIRNMTLNRAHEIYGDTLPDIVHERLEKELSSIINKGYAVLYLIAQKLVYKSVSDGYLVGSRGSVGSSFVATMCGITEVNPLPPHYVCPNCKHSEFITDGSFGSGADMPDKYCPNCNTKMKKDGHDIPFEVFLGFEGDKEPDIDLNFSGEYQPNAHKYTEELFGKGHVFRAGTIGTIAEKTAYGFVKKYLESRQMVVSQAEIDRLTIGCTGVKRTTGQHPGGVMVVPRDNEIYQFTPIQHPADDSKSEIITTHFDYHSISGRLLKLDILGHDDPTIIRMLQDLTGIDPTKIPLGDEKVMSLFTSPKALGVTKEDINCEVGTLGLPEFGTKFVRQMLVDTQPKTFAELVRISGLSHGTDAWLNNAQSLIKDGTATLNEVISTRDDIMLYLIQKGVKPKLSFTIMEKVRKGKGLKEEDIAEMKNNNVPDWYIESCKKIKYMFPKGHAVAYVMMAVRIAYFKVYYPLAYYAAYFTVRADEFDANIVINDEKTIRGKIKQIESLGNGATQKDKGLLTVLEIVLEMKKRGLNFHKVDIYESDPVKFLIKDNALLPPLNSLQGLGDTAAKSIAKERVCGKFISMEDLRDRAKVSKTVIEILKDHGCLNGIPESNQLTLF